MLKLVLPSVMVSLCFAFQTELFCKDNLTARLEWTTDAKLRLLLLKFHIPKAIFEENNLYGFMLSSYGDVENADVLLIDGTDWGVTLKDMWTDGKGFLHEDLSNDFKLNKFEVGDDEYVISVNRSANTCQPHDYVIDDGTTNILNIFPYLERENTSCNVTFYKYAVEEAENYHIRVQLLKTSTDYNVDTSGILSFDILAPNITIPNTTTTYFCSVHALPKMSEKVHAVGFAGIISSKSKGLVHHIEIFSCDVNDGVIPRFAGKCSSSLKPKALDKCRHVIAAWAFGAADFFFPGEAGLSLGGSSMSKYVRLEVHYNNPKMYNNIQDTSGIRFFYTTKLRKYNVGIIEVGTTYTSSMAIPPKQNRFAWTGLCPATCTEKALPPGGIHVFGSELHAHLAGTKIWTSLYRNGRKVVDISRDNHYSTWFEEIRYISPSTLVLPGDVMVTTCLFNTRDRSKVTFGGLGIHEEMCVNYLYYYPASNLEICKSSVSLASLKAFFALENASKGEIASKISHQSTSFVYNDLNWNRENVQSLQLLYRDGPIDVHCLHRNGSSWLNQTQSLRRRFSTTMQPPVDKC